MHSSAQPSILIAQNSSTKSFCLDFYGAMVYLVVERKNMKKHTLFVWVLALLVGVMLLPAMAQDDTDGTTPIEKASEKTKKGKNTVSPVMEAISKLRTFNGKPNKKAQYFIYLQSASWCGPCRDEMPKIVEAYKKMKKRGVEIILFSCDNTDEDAKNFAKVFKMKFPITTQYKKLENSIPGFTKARGIPSATIVDENGKVLMSGHGSIIMKWEEIIKKAEQAKKAGEENDEE